MIVAGLLLLCMIVLGFLFRKSNIVFGIQFLVMYVFMGFTGLIVDQGEYIRLYNVTKLNEVRMDALYWYLAIAFRSLHLSYESFIAIMVFIFLGAFFITIHLYMNEYKCLFASILCIYPFFDIVVQRRCFFALIIMFCGCVWLSEKSYSTTKKVVCYIAIILLASLFHRSFLLYLGFLLAYYLKPRTIRIFSYIIGILGIALCEVFYRIGTKVFEGSHIALYFQGIGANTSIIIIAGFIGFQILTVHLFDSLYTHANEPSEALLWVQKTNMLTLAFIPLYLMDLTFFRMYRNCILFSYYGFFMLAKNQDLKESRQKILAVAAFTLITAFAFAMYIMYNDSVLWGILGKNRILKLLLG